MPEQLLMNIIGFLITCILALAVYIFNGLKKSIETKMDNITNEMSKKMDNITKEMSSMNKELIKVVSNQEWHFGAITRLQSDVKDLQDSQQHKGVEL